MKKNKLITILLIILIIIVISFITIKFSSNYSKLPNPEVSSGLRGELGIDKNINEDNIDEYLSREDIVFYDMRMLIDDAQYENIGGDSYLSGFIKGFEVIPYPYLAPVINLPEEVGEAYKGRTLFSLNENNEYIPNYKESNDILEYLFPKDKIIFLMCGGGGYAGMTKIMLVSLGWDENKIYNVGGYWYYNGKNNIVVKRVNNDNSISYDFWKIPYHNIDFDKLHEVK